MAAVWRHQRERFDSGKAALDEWLRRYAGQNRRRDTAATWVIADAENRVVAYASVAMTGIDRSAAPEIVATGAPDPVPALLLGRLALDHRHANLASEPPWRRASWPPPSSSTRRQPAALSSSPRWTNTRGPGGSGLAFIRSTRTIPVSWTSTCSLPRSTRRSSERDNTRQRKRRALLGDGHTRIPA